jgi:hypothetical protein
VCDTLWGVSALPESRPEVLMPGASSCAGLTPYEPLGLPGGEVLRRRVEARLRREGYNVEGLAREIVRMAEECL